MEKMEKLVLTDLPEFCLDKVLSSLRLIDLIAAAETNITVRTSAFRVFKWKYETQEITYRNPRPNCGCNCIKNAIFYPDDLISASNHFGPLMHQLKLDVGEDQNDNQRILQEISRNCDSLNKLEVCLNHADFAIDSQIPSVEKLVYHVQNDRFHESWAELNRWFPNLKMFKMKTFFHLKPSIVAHIPNLEHFSCAANSIGPKIGRNLQIFIDFLNANPQLRILELDGCNCTFSDSQSLFSSTDWDQTKIQELILDAKSGEFRATDIQRMINLQSLSLTGFDDYRDFEKLDLPRLDTLSIEITEDNKTSAINSIEILKNLKNLKNLTIVLEFKYIIVPEFLADLNSKLPKMCHAYRVKSLVLN